MNEAILQDKYLIHFLTKRNGGLGYKEVKANTVAWKTLLIEEDLLSFLSDTEENKKAWKQLLPQFGNSDEKALAAFVEFLLERMKDATNMAIFINSNKTVTFKGVQFYLFYPSGTEMHGDRLFDQNIFSVVQEMPYNFRHEGTKHYGIRPDVTFFINGIYFGYTELKSNYTNQSAHKNGRGKVIRDYEKAAEAYLKIADTNDTNKSIQKKFLKFFHKAVHITTTDIQNTFVIRTIGNHLESIKKDSTEKGESYQETVTRDFKKYPLLKPESQYESRTEKFEEVFKALYSKKMIEREILYYNFMERELEKDDKGVKRMRHSRARLIAPRPKQKFGADKILSRIDEFLEHENDDDYFINKLRQELLEKNVGRVQTDELIEQRLKYKNNKNIYSLLLQYAAGFGKSNIIGWTALQLKDIKRNDAYVYDKIMLIVDRVQLRDQLDTKLQNMNISKSMFTEVRSKSDFKKALVTDKRIVVVNLQKFNSIRDVLDEEALTALAEIRVAFLIDEIHRSHSNVQHQEMVTLFDELQTTFDKNKKYQAKRKKKNLIIGFTATPSDVTLSRFGEFDVYAESQQVMVPFDSYTMAEAINDGYILNPLTGLVPVAAKMYYDLPEDPAKGLHDKELEYTIKKKKYYENPERIEEVAKFITERLVANVYPNIKGKAKAMLAVYSIDTAILYFKQIKKYYAKAVERKKKYQRFIGAPIYVVFSDNQHSETAKSLNGGISEGKVLQKFAIDKNALIIVVDKLQTGFDEPYLHTLFLDKEIKGINAIQTISRVNRTIKYKDDCKIVDFSQQNVNITNIHKAFEKFSNVVVSDFDPLQQEKFLEQLHKELKENSLYVKNHHSFNRARAAEPSDAATLLQIENNFERYIKDEKEGAFMLKGRVNDYFRILHAIEYLIDTDDKHSDDDFQEFWKFYNKIYNTLSPAGVMKDDVSIYYDYKLGIVPPPDYEAGSGGKKQVREPKGRYPGKGKQTNILALIEQKNEDEAAIEIKIDEFAERIDEFYSYLENPDESSSARLVAKMRNRSGAFGEEEIFTDFTKLYKRYVRRNKNELSEFFIRESGDSLRQLYDNFESQVVEEEVNTVAYFSITLDKDYYKYTNEELVNLLFELQEGLNLSGALKLLLKERGSIQLTLEAPNQTDVDLFMKLSASGALDKYGLGNFRVIPNRHLKEEVAAKNSSEPKQIREYKNLLAASELKELIRRLLTETTSFLEINAEVILISARLERFRKSKRCGVLTYDEINITMNRISADLSDLVLELSDEKYKFN